MNISETIHLLGDLLGQVISELESPAIFDIEERIRALAKARRNNKPDAAQKLQSESSSLSVEEARAVASAFATYFDLVNLAEEKQHALTLQKEEKESEREPAKETIDEAIAILKTHGVTDEQMSTILSNLSIELVLTAHPTEARRRTVFSKLERISSFLKQLDNTDLSAREKNDITQSLRSEISSLWLTERTRTAKLTVTDEVRTGLFFVDSFFWETLPKIYAELENALKLHYPKLAPPSNWLRLASWIGGDRDGNPNVTTEITAETLRLHRGLAVENHRRSLKTLARHLSVSSKRIPPPQSLTEWLELRKPFPSHISYIKERYVTEPYRLALSLLANDLAEASRDEMKTHLLQQYSHKTKLYSADITQVLDFIASVMPSALKEDDLKRTQREMDIFGLHAARLDLREESSQLDAALSEILRALNIESDFENLPATDRTDLLSRLLAEPTPTFSQHPGVTLATAETWALFQLIGRACELYGTELFGPFIISMTRDSANVLSVLLLAKWAGGNAVPQIAPLFETIEDLKEAPRVLEFLFTTEAYRAQLEAYKNEQIVMIGYSDSNKDGGYLMANWSLYQAQEEIADITKKHNIKLTLFHGRGGTIARGGGPTNKAIRAQPAGSINGRFRLTEQGETIAFRYAHPALAYRHLEQITSAVLLASSPKRDKTIPTKWREVMAEISERAQRTYRQLVYETPGFITFWEQATPLNEIKHLRIGSRPAARAKSGAVNQIRAIPWVFSWMQSRFNLPGWYSLGSGLASIKDIGIFKEMYEGWPFFSTMLNNTEMSLLKADMDISALYVDLVEDKKLASKIFSNIRDEYERTRETTLAISGHNTLLELEPITQQAIHVRNPYVDPLNYLQVEILRRLRALPDQNSAQATSLREVMSLTINGIASGLRNTG
ncbi:MAG: phosphoenolpyruvate carboxylase [Chloroflexi bacterium]|nr:phosphoenolpyruvate carboxylase [Chloroflexota bacterium]